MPKIAGETAHETGRQGALRASNLLWKLLGDNLALPFNAYDHGEKLTFEDIAAPHAKFAFDLKGILRHPNEHRFSGQESVEVFVEVKAHSTGSALLQEYRDFLRRAAIVSTQPAHTSTWFIFVAGAPFGTSVGAELCNGKLLGECRAAWPPALATSAIGLHERVSLVIATPSMERLLGKWSRNV